MAELYEIMSHFLHFCFWSDSDAPCIVELVGWLEQKIELDGLKYIEIDLVQKNKWNWSHNLRARGDWKMGHFEHFLFFY